MVNDGGIQRSMLTSFTIAFSDAVTFPNGFAAGIQLQRTGPGNPVGLVNLNFVQNENTVTVTFDDINYAPDAPKSLIDGNFSLTLIADKIQGAGGFLDGDNDGVPGANLVMTTHRVFGDADGNVSVNAIDFAAFRGFFGIASPSIFDFNNDGVVNATDFAQFRARFGVTLTP